MSDGWMTNSPANRRSHTSSNPGSQPGSETKARPDATAESMVTGPWGWMSPYRWAEKTATGWASS